MKLYLDDERIEPEGWVRVTTGENCIAVLRDNPGAFEALSLDHDLDDRVDTRSGYAEPAPLTGYDVACWLEQEAHDGRWQHVPNLLTCHSANPQGAKRIMQAIEKIAEMRGGR